MWTGAPSARGLAPNFQPITVAARAMRRSRVVTSHLDRYLLGEVMASGGMSSVHLGRMRGAAGFGRTVAIKRLHPQYATDPDFVAMMLDEAKLVSRISHPNVVATLDVVHTDSSLFLILDYVHGETLATIHRTLAAEGRRIPLPIARAIASAMLLGLDAAHEATDELGHALGVVHRDVSPQNVMIGADGGVRVLDFGVAKAASFSHQSDAGQIKGKLAYMAPEQLAGTTVTRAADLYGASVVLWEMLTGRRLYEAMEKAQIAFLVMNGAARSPRTVEPEVPEDLADLVMRGLERDPERRFPTARAMAEAIEATGPAATVREIAAWLEEVLHDSLATKAERVARMERDTVEATDVRELASSLAAASAATPPSQTTPPALGPVEGSLEATTSVSSSDQPKLARPVWPVAAIALGIGAGILLMRLSGGRVDHAPTAPAARDEHAAAPQDLQPGTGPAPSVAPARAPGDPSSTPPDGPANTAPPRAGPSPDASDAPVVTPVAPAPRPRLPPRKSAGSPQPKATQDGLFDRN